MLVSFVVVVSVGLGLAAEAHGVTLCSTGPGKSVVAPSANGKCANGQHSLSLASQATVSSLRKRVKALEDTLAGVSRSGTTLRFRHMNLQLINGAGATGVVNGLGNLIIGYDEPGDTGHGPTPPPTKTGSHNLVLGRNNSFTSAGGIVVGYSNTLSGQFSAVFGEFNTASGGTSAVTGGINNVASGSDSSVSGGDGNTAIGGSVSGGAGNTASALFSSISGGRNNKTSSGDSSILGGYQNETKGSGSTVSGGFDNIPTGQYSSILGGGSIRGTTTHSCSGVIYGFFPACN
jgi:hypothetical protein